MKEVADGCLMTSNDQHPRRRLFDFNDVLIDVVALCAFERAQIVARLGWIDAGEFHFRTTLRAGCLHEKIAK